MMSISTRYEKIKIIKIKRSQCPSTYNKRKTFTTVIFCDEINRKIKAMGKWTNNWKEGEVVEGFLKESSYNNDWGGITTSYYLERLKESYNIYEYYSLYRQGAVLASDEDLKEFKEAGLLD